MKYKITKMTAAFGRKWKAKKIFEYNNQLKYRRKFKSLSKIVDKSTRSLVSVKIFGEKWVDDKWKIIEIYPEEEEEL